MNEALSDTDNPSHLHVDLESNIFFPRKTYLPNHGLPNVMEKSVYLLRQRRKLLGRLQKPPGISDLPQISPGRSKSGGPIW